MRPKLTGQTTWSYYNSPAPAVSENAWCCWCGEGFEVATVKADACMHACSACGGVTRVSVEMHVHVGVDIMPGEPPPENEGGEK